ncbi:MAG TPA: hypothetical protein VFO28_15885 [Burkholderiaceae bacterium]|nr:hypothetical protein [Burkholderiaceae bacterium]
MRHLLPTGLTLAIGLTSTSGHAADDLAALRAEMQALRASYEQRMQALEARLQAAERAAAPTATPNAAPTAAAPAAPAAQAPTPAAPPASPPTTASADANRFNPAISLILSGLYTRTSHDPANYTITGFARPEDAEIGPGTRGFSLAETELTLSASIDPWWRGAATIAVTPENEVELEEAFVQTTALGNGLTLKAGRFLSNVGYLNPQHAHVWDFVDAPLAYQALLGGQLGDDGLQLNWLAPLDTFVELSAEVGRGRGFPGSDTSRNGAGRASLALHAGGDIGASHSWRAGVSYIDAKASDQVLFGLDPSDAGIDSLFNGRTRVTVLDAVWKWAPDGNASRTNFKLQGEWLRSVRSGTLNHDPSGANLDGDLRATQTGGYVQAVYQFMPRWRVGLRTERLDAGTPEYAPGALGADGFKPKKHTLMVDYGSSEFSRVRLQLARDQARLGITDNQLMLQYQMSLGAHGAHGF